MNSASTSNIDLQSWWEVPSIAHFCSLFRVAFNLLDFDIEELEEALLTDGTELNGSSLLQELIVRLLSGCLGHNGISTSNYQMFLRRLFRTKCKEQGRENPFNTDIDFQFLPLRTKVEILHVLCDFRLDADDVVDVLKNLDSDSLRVHPLGYDENRSAYWYFYGTRLYREDYPKKRKKKKDRDKYKAKKKRKEDSSSEDEEEQEEEEEDTGWPPALGSWQVMCYTEEDWRKLAHSLAHSSCKEEKALYQVLSEDFLPEIPRLFEEKERLQRKRLLENQPRRQSQRIEKLKSQKEVAPPSSSSSSELSKLQTKTRQERDKERANRCKGRAEKNRRKRSVSRSNSESGSSLNNVLPSGRQTNNSLASATGEIYIKTNNSQKFRSALFRRTHEDLMTGLYKILDRVKAHDDAWPFRVPVDEKFAPRYYAVIARPMDLQTMEDKLDNAEYGSLPEFRADFQLIVDNCRQYNGSGNEYTDMAKRLQILFEACAERFFEAEPSSDDSLPPLRRHGAEDIDQDEDSLGSSLTPDERIPSIGKQSVVSSSGESIVMSDGSSATIDEYVPGRGRVEHDSRKRKRRKVRRGQQAELSGESDSSSRSDSMSEASRTSIRHERNVSSLDGSYDRSADKGRSFSQRRSKTDEEKERLFEDEIERTRPKVNYKEEDTSESDLLTDSSEDSFTANNKNKNKLGQIKRIVRRAGVFKNQELIEELDQVTKDVLMDITRMLEDIPIFSDFSSNSNSPLHTPSYVLDDSTMEGEFRKRISHSNRPRDRFSNEIHRRRLYKEQLGIKRKREIQRTIDRLQPGKSKGNLLSKDKKVEEDPAGEPKVADNNSSTPCISLGKVLETDVLGFGICENTALKKESEDELTQDKLTIEEEVEVREEKLVPKEEEILEKKPDVEVVEKVVEPVAKKKEKPTPNLSAWFKAFGAPKPTSVPKRKPELDENRGNDKKDDEMVDEEKKGGEMELPARRQRKTSTGSSVSERSSFSQEPLDGNSPRPSLDEPYQSPQPELKLYHHPPINGTIKVGFYQDTCFPRGSSEKSSSSPRDPPSCSPRDLPSVSPRTPYCSPRNTPIGSRDYPSSSPRTPYSRTLMISPRDYPASPRTEYNNDIMMRREYPPSASPREYPVPMSPREYPPSACHREYISPSSPREYPPPASPREYPNPTSPQEYTSPASPREYRTPPSPRDYPPANSREYSPNPPTLQEYREPVGPREYPPPSSPRELRRTPVNREALSSPHPQDECQLPRPEYEAYNAPRSPSTPIYSGVPPYPSHLYFEANKQVAEFRPNLEKTPVYPVKKRAYNEIVNNSPACSPEPPLPLKSGGSFTPTRGAMEQERTFTPTPGRLPGPSTTTSIPIGLPHHPLQQHIMDQFAEEGRRISSPFYPTETVFNKPQPASSMFAPQFINRGDRSSRSSTPHPPNSPSSVPINYSNPASCKEPPRSPTPQKETTIVNAPSLNYAKVTTNDLHLPKVSSSSTLAYSTSRIEEMLQDRVSPQFNRSLTDIPHFPSGQDLSKLQQLHQSEIQRYSQMANLGYNYHQMIQGKSPSVYNHPMQELIQTKAASFGNMMQSNLSTFARPMADILPGKVNEREVPFTPRPPPKLADKPPKKNRKKKVETSTSGFQQYVGSNTESPTVPGSAFNFGPPTPQSLKEGGYGTAPFLEPPYYDSSPGKPPFFLGQGAAAYPPHHPFISQAQYQEYLLHHGVLPPTPGYPSPAAYLGIHSPINRPSWL